MQLNNKFLFDRDFDVEKVNQQRAHEEQQASTDSPPAPMFDEETLNLARHQAYQQGVQDGREAAEHNQQQMLAGLWDRAGYQLAALLAQDTVREQQAMTLAVRSAFHVIKKFWPKLQQPTLQQDIEQFISEQLASNSEETRIVLRVNDAHLDAIASQLPRLKDLQGFQGKVITIADDSVALGDCKMEWADGGAEKLGRHMLQQLDQIMDHLLGALSQPGNLQVPSLSTHQHDHEQETSE